MLKLAKAVNEDAVSVGMQGTDSGVDLRSEIDAKRAELAQKGISAHSVEGARVLDPLYERLEGTKPLRRGMG